ncbi:RimJ/RimL family protein N-acetyltransferase [Paenibacillus amylolyticus]|uniref:RimJ/RimL family protein N-acetyltransferase n=1 Tax=Paenibacillus amylolyticus TaxID=1451 RepID=A0AAP5LPD5_PAEAM|nr:GNAT family protein [Paenibacillus amylolyticus]MDR6726742.1 RimJ/RimL family protein N-acetyltransferase [Paenibacillus amylolyticus]
MEYIGKHVRITQATEEDLDFLCRLECDPSIWVYEESVESDEEKVREKYREQLPTSAERYAYDFIIRRVDDSENTPIGLVQMWSYVDFRKSWELGFGMLPDYTGRGYASEATRLLLQFAFAEVQAHKVVGMCNAQNTRSALLMEKVGMKREGIFRDELFWNDQYVDQYFFSVLKSEFFADAGVEEEGV